MAWDYAYEKIGIGKTGYMVYKTLEIDTTKKNLESTQKNFAEILCGKQGSKQVQNVIFMLSKMFHLPNG